jgi:hypothetical protein
LLIGVSEYEPGLAALPAAVQDIKAMQRVLKDSEMGGFDIVKSLANPDPQAMQYEIETLLSGATKDDLVLLYFSGHGIKDDAHRLYFATRITRKNEKGELIRSTAVPSYFVSDIMNHSRSRRQVIILDCCFSGAFDPALQAKDDGLVDLQAQLGAEGRVVLASSSSTEYSFEQKGAELSLYTRYLIEGIETGAGDKNSDGLVSTLELYEYAKSKVQEIAPMMTPKIIVMKDKGFEIVLAKARVSDPKLKYRKEASRCYANGIIRPTGRAMLDALRNRLALTAEETDAIEAETLQLYQERIANLERYRETLLSEAKHKYPLDEVALEDLNMLQQMLGLRNIDILPIHQEVEVRFFKRPEAPDEQKEEEQQPIYQSSLDTMRELPLTADELKTGVEKEIAHPKGSFKIITPAGISVGQKMRIPGKGNYDSITQKCGDLYLVAVEGKTQPYCNKIAVSKGKTAEALGVETLGGIMSILVKKDTRLPVRVSEFFSTAVDDQADAEIHILKGTRKLAEDNESLGGFRLEGIPPAPKGKPKIEVTFCIDRNGVLTVRARDTRTGKQQSVTVTGKSFICMQKELSIKCSSLPSGRSTCVWKDDQGLEHVLYFDQNLEYLYFNQALRHWVALLKSASARSNPFSRVLDAFASQTAFQSQQLISLSPSIAAPDTSAWPTYQLYSEWISNERKRGWWLDSDRVSHCLEWNPSKEYAHQDVATREWYILKYEV